MILAMASLSGIASAQESSIDKWKSPGRIVFPAGTLQLSETLEIDLAKDGSLHILGEGRSRIVMNGPGPAIRIVGTHGGTADPKTVTPEVWKRENAPLIADLEIIGNHPEADGVELIGTMQATIRDLTVRRTRHAIRLSQRNRNVNIANCQIYDNRGAGIYYDHLSLHQSNITGCHISYNAGGGIVMRGGDVRNVHITGCDIEGNMGGPEAPATANVMLDAEDGSIGEVAITGCTIQHTHDAEDSANIWINFQSNPRPFTEELRHGNVTISGNVLSDVRRNIYLQHIRGAAITGNTIWKGYDHNLLLENCEAVTVTGNTMDRNPRYHYGDGPDAKLGIRLSGCKRCTLSSNVINGVGDVDAAIELHQSSQIIVSQSTISGFPRVGVLLDQVTQSIVADCIINCGKAADAEAIREVAGKDNRVADNTVIEER